MLRFELYRKVPPRAVLDLSDDGDYREYLLSFRCSDSSFAGVGRSSAFMKETLWKSPRKSSYLKRLVSTERAFSPREIDTGFTLVVVFPITDVITGARVSAKLQRLIRDGESV